MRQLIAMMVVVAVLSGCAGEPKHPAWKNATGAEQHERLMWQAIKDKDWTNVERHLSPTFIGVSADGRVFDRESWLQHWQSAQVVEFSLGEVQVQPEGADTKITYIFHKQGSGAEVAPSGGLRVVSVWQQLKNRWMLTATSLTPILK